MTQQEIDQYWIRQAEAARPMAPPSWQRPVEKYEREMVNDQPAESPTWHSIALGALLWTALAIPAALLGALAGWLVWIVRHQ